MKKRFVKLIAAIVAIFCGLFAFSACSKVEFKVNFVVDGAVYATLNTNGEEIIKMPENPTKDDYDFDGWYWDKDTWQTPFTANSLLDAPLSSDMNVYCKWKPKTVHVSGISLNKSEVSLHVDETEILTATITPANATDTSVLWESSNATIATVTGGKITALRVGSATITATANDGGQIASCEVYVTPIYVESVSLNYTQLSMLYGESKTLTASVVPQNATETGVIWQSSNASVVAVENGKLTATGYGSAVITVTTADGGKTATCAVEVIDDTITFKTLQVAADGETIYGKVSNATTTFSFLKEIEEHGNATYQAYKEITCETLLASKSISLNVGDNTVYILQTGGKDLKLYTVTVRRRPIYNVSFDTDGGTAVQSQQAEEDSFVTAPAEPSRIGYTFTRWNYDFSQAITQDTEIKAVWSAHTDTKYRVEYYWENVENDEYTLHETSDMQGTTDTAATAEQKAYEHFTLNAAASTMQGNIAGDGSLILKVYYTRDKYNVTFESNGGTLKSGEVNQILKYEGSAAAPVFTRTGYTFIGWNKTIPESVYENITITAQWKINQYSLTLIYGNGQPDKIITQDYNSIIEAVPDPKRAEYGFIGWDQKIPESMPAENITRMAKWNSASIFKRSASGDTITGLTDNGKKYTEIGIPAEIKGIKITTIGEAAFRECSSLTSVTIPDSVTSIGGSAFYRCSGLTSITIPDSVTYIGEYAFYNCYNLKSVTIGNSVTIIDDDAFGCCSKLTSVAIPDSVTSIGRNAFYNCLSLTSVTIPNSVTYIGGQEFNGCVSLKYNVKDHLMYLGNSENPYLY